MDELVERTENGTSPKNIGAGRLFLCFCIVIYCGWQLYEWYATGEILIGKNNSHWHSYRDSPTLFVIVAFINLSLFLAYGYTLIRLLIIKFRGNRGIVKLHWWENMGGD